jgi:hypothetical protein
VKLEHGSIEGFQIGGGGLTGIVNLELKPQSDKYEFIAFKQPYYLQIKSKEDSDTIFVEIWKLMPLFKSAEDILKLSASQD